MDRRPAGVLVLALVLLAAAVAPRIPTKVIAGQPTAQPVPGPPAVGACVTSRIPDRSGNVDDGRFITLPSLVYGDCSVAHYGEVTAVKADIPLQRRPITAEMSGPGYELWETCPSTELTYAGLADPPSGSAVDPAAWSPALRAGLVFAGPDRRQQAAGQHWGACILVGVDRDTGAALAYTGSANGTLRSGRIPPEFAYCSASVTEDVAQPCAGPHRFQILGTADLSTTIAPPSKVLADCRTLALRVTRMPDPTAGGRLQVLVHTQRFAPDGSALAETGPHKDGEYSFGICAIGAAAPATLTGSLFGLGSDPVPLR